MRRMESALHLATAALTMLAAGAALVMTVQPDAPELVSEWWRARRMHGPNVNHARLEWMREQVQAGFYADDVAPDVSPL